MWSAASSSSGFVLDLASLESMKARARTSPEQTEAQVARQFEALFVQMMLRSMRQASFKSELFDNQQTRMMQSLQDEQTALQMSEQRGLGLAEVLLAQMQRVRAARDTAEQLGHQPGEAAGLPVQAATPGHPAAGAAASRAMNETVAGLPTFAAASPPHRLYGNQASAGAMSTDAAAEAPAGTRAAGAIASVLHSIQAGAQAAVSHGAELGRRAVEVPAHVEVFVRRLHDSAERVAHASGLPKRLILAQAALESGWGRHEIRFADGRPSHNLFGIKATGGWRGRVAEVITTEYVNGSPQRVREPFRAYGSYDEALHDYARLLTGNPRYREVLEAGSDAEAARRVQQAGYATDPRYADKLIAIMRQLPV